MLARTMAGVASLGLVRTIPLTPRRFAGSISPIGGGAPLPAPETVLRFREQHPCEQPATNAGEDRPTGSPPVV